MTMMKFELNETEIENINKFFEKHRHPDVYKGAIGGHIDIIFTPTSIGDACNVRCKICGEEEDVTDYSNW